MKTYHAEVQDTGGEVVLVEVYAIRARDGFCLCRPLNPKKDGSAHFSANPAKVKMISARTH